MSTIYVPAGGTGRTVAGINNVIFGAGTSSVTDYAQDTVFAGSGADTVYISAGTSTVVGSTGALTVDAFAFMPTVTTVFAGAGGLTFNGGIGGTDIVVGNGNPITVNGSTGGGQYFGGGNSTITASGQSVLVGSSGDTLNLQDFAAKPSSGLFGVAAGAGNVTLNALYSTGDNVFFGAAATGPMTFIGSRGNDIYGLGQGSNTVTLGFGHDTVFDNTGTTSVSTITAGIGSADIAFGGASANLIISPYAGVFRASDPRTFSLFNVVPGADKVTLSGYAPAQAASALSNQVNTGGSTFLTVPGTTTSGQVNISLVGLAHADASLFG